MQPQKAIRVAFGDKGLEVKFLEGLWTRKDVTRVYAAMLKALPIHTGEVKKKLKEKEDAKKRIGRK